MRIRARRARNSEQTAAVVQTWRPDAVGANQVESVMARNGALLGGFTSPTPAGWGLAGSVETTDSHIWASPQAFNGGGGQVALASLTMGAAKPTAYPMDAHTTNVVLPGRMGV